MQTEIKIGLLKYRDALKYKMGDRHIWIAKREGDTVFVQFRKMALLTEEEKQEYRLLQSPRSKLIERAHSKFCIWVNESMLSFEAINCLHHSLNELKNLKSERDKV